MQEGLGIYTVEHYLKVRLACWEGMSRHQAAKHFNISRDSVAKTMSYSTPPGYQRHSPIRRPKLDGSTPAEATVAQTRQTTMADTLKEERIRIRAHEIWERDGSPHGQQDEHWHRARDEIEMEDEDAEGLQRTLTENGADGWNGAAIIASRSFSRYGANA